MGAQPGDGEPPGKCRVGRGHTRVYVCTRACVCVVSAPGRPSGALADGSSATLNMGVSRLPRSGKLPEPPGRLLPSLGGPQTLQERQEDVVQSGLEEGVCGFVPSCGLLGVALQRNPGLGHAGLGSVPQSASY